LKSAGHVQAVQRAHPQLRPMAASEVRAEIEGVFGQSRFKPSSGRPVSFKVKVYLLCFTRRQFSAENMLRDGVRPFGEM
jgi:hypothetical protein